MKYGLEFAGAKKRVRRDWGATVLAVVTLLAMSALCGWLIVCVRGATAQTWRLGDLETGRLVAMAPISQGMVFGLLLSLSVVGIVLAVRKVRENERWCEELRQRQVQRKHRVLAARRMTNDECGMTNDVPPSVIDENACCWDEMTGEEMRWSAADEGTRAPVGAVAPADLRRIVGAMVVETSEARDYVRKARVTLSVDDYGDMLTCAEGKLHMVIGCLGGLLDRVDAGEGTRAPTDEGRAA